jgi:hypothetical protein
MKNYQSNRMSVIAVVAPLSKINIDSRVFFTIDGGVLVNGLVIMVF